MGFFGSGDKSQSATDQQVGASDSGQAVNATGSNVASGQGRNIGSGSVGAQDNGTVISGGAAVASQGLVNSTNTGTITYGIPSGDVANLLSDTTTKIGDLVSKQTDAATNEISATLASLSDLALSKQTDGQSSRDNTILWVIGLVAAALVTVLVWRK